MVFDYPAKSGIRQIRAIVDPAAIEVVGTLKRRRGGGEELLAYKQGSRWRDIKSGDINEYIKEITGGDYSAKDFRTWNATVLAAVALAVAGEVAGTKTGRKRAVTRAVKEVSHYLGNTPGGLPGLLHRPARLRRLRGRAHHRTRSAEGRRGGRRRDGDPPAAARARGRRPDRRARGGSGRREDRGLSPGPCCGRSDVPQPAHVSPGLAVASAPCGRVGGGGHTGQRLDHLLCVRSAESKARARSTSGGLAASCGRALLDDSLRCAPEGQTSAATPMPTKISATTTTQAARNCRSRLGVSQAGGGRNCRTSGSSSRAHHRRAPQRRAGPRLRRRCSRWPNPRGERRSAG